MLSMITNIESLSAQRNMSKTRRALAANFGRLSSGLRINNAGDDAAGLAISEKLKAQIRSLGQAERNANDAISLLQTAEGAMNEVSGILTRMRELATQAANGTLGTTERTFINNEMTALTNEIDRIADVTDFNGQRLLNGTATGLGFQVGVGDTSADRISISIQDVHTSQLSGLATADVLSVSSATAALSIVDKAIDRISSARASIGSVQNRLMVTISNLSSARENVSAANSRIRDVDVALESSELTKNNILLQAGASVLTQANQAPSLALNLLK